MDAAMLGEEKRFETGSAFHTFNVEDLIPKEHMLRRIDAVLDLSWLREEVAPCYSDLGRRSWDPEVIVRMILLGYLYDLSEVRLVDEVRMHMGYRWFCRLQPSDSVPDRTTLVKLRNEKWKSALWVKVLDRTIRQCQEAGLVSGRHVSVDGTKIKANAAWGSLEPIEPPVSLLEHLERRCGWECSEPEAKPEEPTDPDDDTDPTPRGGVRFKGKKLKNSEMRSKTDPDARLYRKDDGEGSGLAYLGNLCIDTKSRVILGAEASPGRTSGEWEAGANLLDEVERVLGRKPKIVTADKGYGVMRFYAEAERRGITAHIPSQGHGKPVEIRHCRILSRQVVDFEKGRDYARKRIGARGKNRALREARTPGYRVSRLLRLRVEHVIGEAKECHGLRRARHRGLDKVDTQIKITAAVINLKRLAAHWHRVAPAAKTGFSTRFSALMRPRGTLRRLLRQLSVVLRKLAFVGPDLAPQPDLT